MDKKIVVKALGMIAALATGFATIVNGDLLSGVGIIGASLSSANLTGSATDGQ